MSTRTRGSKGSRGRTRLGIRYFDDRILFTDTHAWAYYRVPSAAFGRPDRIYPTFIVTRMPHGISGLLIAAILAAPVAASVQMNAVLVVVLYQTEPAP